MRIKSKFEVLKEDLQQLIRNLFSSDSIADLENHERDIFEAAGWLTAIASHYKFTKKGSKEFIRAVKRGAKLLNATHKKRNKS